MRFRDVRSLAFAAGLATAAALPAMSYAQQASTGEHEFTFYDDIKDTGPILDDFKAYYKERFGHDVTINYFSQPGEELILTLELEARSRDVKADVVIAHHSAMKQLQNKYNIFEAPLQVEGRDDPNVVASLADPVGDGSGVPALVSCYLIAYNTKLLSPEEAPKSWADLLDERLTNKIGLGDPEVTGGALGPLWFLTQHMASAGSPYGWEFYERLSKLNPYLASSHNALMEMVASGELAVSINSISQVIPAALSGSPVAAVMPEEGCATQIMTAVVTKRDTPNQAAHAFAEWIVTKEGAESFVKHKSSLPTRKDVANPELPFPFNLDPDKLAQIDSDWVAGQRTEFLAKFREAMR
jgi:iron(III) transport system substrate-binding protein